MSHPSSRFLKVFEAVRIVAAGIAVGAFLAACGGGEGKDESMDPQAVAERIKPFGEVAVAGQESTPVADEAPAAAAPAAVATAAPAPAAATTAPAAAAAAAPAAAVDGEATYKAACSACHGLGIAGAPKPGDKAAWAARIAQGTDVLHRHAIEGFKGQAGFMPAKGGRVDLSDAAVAAAVDYMVAGSR